MFRPQMVSFSQFLCANAPKIIAGFVASVGNRNKVARTMRKLAAYMVCTFWSKNGASFCCGRLLIGCETCNRVFDFFELFLTFFKKHRKMKKNYAHKFYFLCAILKIYGKEE
jgi:hypothetical protein